MKIALFPGSFKPPHSGHLKVIETIMKTYKPDKLYIIISNKPRLIVNPYERKLSQFTSAELKNLQTKYNLQSNKKNVIEKAATNGIIPAVNAEITYKFWEIYLKTLPKIMQEKIKVSIANQPSPILYAFVIVKNIVKPTDTLLLLKAEKDAGNKRFSMFDGLNCKKKEVLIPSFKDFNSWQMRKVIGLKKWKEVENFFPDMLKKNEKKELIILLKNIFK